MPFNKRRADTKKPTSKWTRSTPKIKPENLKMFRQIKDENLKKYLAALPEGLLASVGLYAEASTGRWLFRAGKNLPKILETLRQGTPPAVKAATWPIAATRVQEWDDESQSFKPEPMKPQRSPGRTTGTVPKVKKQQEAARNKAKVQKRKKNKSKANMYPPPKRMRLSLRESHN